MDNLYRSTMNRNAFSATSLLIVATILLISFVFSCKFPTEPREKAHYTYIDGKVHADSLYDDSCAMVDIANVCAYFARDSICIELGVRWLFDSVSTSDTSAALSFCYDIHIDMNNDYHIGAGDITATMRLNTLQRKGSLFYLDSFFVSFDNSIDVQVMRLNEPVPHTTLDWASGRIENNTITIAFKNDYGITDKTPIRYSSILWDNNDFVHHVSDYYPDY